MLNLDIESLIRPLVGLKQLNICLAFFVFFLFLLNNPALSNENAICTEFYLNKTNDQSLRFSEHLTARYYNIVDFFRDNVFDRMKKTWRTRSAFITTKEQTAFRVGSGIFLPYRKDWILDNNSDASAKLYEVRNQAFVETHRFKEILRHSTSLTSEQIQRAQEIKLFENILIALKSVAEGPVWFSLHPSWRRSVVGGDEWDIHFSSLSEVSPSGRLLKAMSEMGFELRATLPPGTKFSPDVFNSEFLELETKLTPFELGELGRKLQVHKIFYKKMYYRPDQLNQIYQPLQKQLIKTAGKILEHAQAKESTLESFLEIMRASLSD